MLKTLAKVIESATGGLVTGRFVAGRLATGRLAARKLARKLAAERLMKWDSKSASNKRACCIRARSRRNWVRRIRHAHFH